VAIFVLAILVYGHFGLSLWQFWSWPFWFVAVFDVIRGDWSWICNMPQIYVYHSSCGALPLPTGQELHPVAVLCSWKGKRRSGACCKTKIGHHNQDRSCRSTNHRLRILMRPVLTVATGLGFATRPWCHTGNV